MMCCINVRKLTFMQYTHACDIELNDPIVITVNNNMNIRIMKDLI